MTTGTYTTPITKSDIERLNKSFYDDDKMLSAFDNKPIYIYHM